MSRAKGENLNQPGGDDIESSAGAVDKNAEPLVSDSFASKAAAFQKLLDSGMADTIARRAKKPATREIVIPKPRKGTQEPGQNPWGKPQDPTASSHSAPVSTEYIPVTPGAEAEDVPQALIDDSPQMAEEPPHATDEPPQTEEPAVEAAAVIVAALETPVEEFPNTVEAHKEELQVQENNNEGVESEATTTEDQRLADDQQVSYGHAEALAVEEEKPWPFQNGDSEEETGARAGSQKKRIEVTPLGAGLMGIVQDTARGVGGLGSGCARWVKKNYIPKRRKAGDGAGAEQGAEEDYPWREEGSTTGPSADNFGRSASSAASVTEKVASSVMAVGAGVGKVAGYVARGAVEGPVDMFRYTRKTVSCVTGDVAKRFGARKGNSEE
jgi:hypothetical protein